MEVFYHQVMLSRLQFAFNTMFHIIWLLLSIGLSIFMVAAGNAFLQRLSIPSFPGQSRRRLWGVIKLGKQGTRVKVKEQGERRNSFS
jgi:hypothetical protein